MFYNYQGNILNCTSVGCSLQVSTLSEMTRHTASVVATDDESVDSLVVVDVVQTTQMPGVLHCSAASCLPSASFHCVSCYLCWPSFCQLCWFGGRKSIRLEKI